MALLALMAWAELRGDPEVNAFGRRISAGTQRQALTIALLALAGVLACTLVLIMRRARST